MENKRVFEIHELEIKYGCFDTYPHIEIDFEFNVSDWRVQYVVYNKWKYIVKSSASNHKQNESHFSCSVLSQKSTNEPNGIHMIKRDD